jgi:hypothetical protein
VKENWRHIVNESHCPRPKVLESYYSGTLEPDQCFLVENHLADCDLCNDYVEGLSSLPENFDLNRTEAELKENVLKLLEDKKRNRTRNLIYRRFAVAASFLLLLGVSGYLVFHQKLIVPQLTEEVNSMVQPFDSTLEILPAISKTKDIVLLKSETKSQSLPREVAAIPVKIIKAEDDFKVAVDEKQLGKVSDITTIELKPEEKVFTESAPLNKPDKNNDVRITITGNVVDASGEPLTGVTVVEKSKSNGGISNTDGKFQLKIEPGDTLQFSMVGYKKISVKPDSSSTMEITLYPEEFALNDVVVVGYGVSKKSKRTGSVSSINSGELDQSTSGSGKKILSMEKEFNELPDSLKNNWTIAKYESERQLILENSERSLVALTSLLSITVNTEQHDSIVDAIELVKTGKFKRALKTISPMIKRE